MIFGYLMKLTRLILAPSPRHLAKGEASAHVTGHSYQMPNVFFNKFTPEL